MFKLQVVASKNKAAQCKYEVKVNLKTKKKKCKLISTG